MCVPLYQVNNYGLLLIFQNYPHCDTLTIDILVSKVLLLVWFWWIYMEAYSYKKKKENSIYKVTYLSNLLKVMPKHFSDINTSQIDIVREYLVRTLYTFIHFL